MAWRQVLALTRMRLLLLLREPEGLFWTLAFPILLATALGHAFGDVAPGPYPGARYVDYLFPGLLGLNVAATGLWAIGFAVVEERQGHLLRRLLATPMRRSAYLLSFVLSRLLFLVLELAVLLAFGAWVLGIPLRGSVAALVVLALAGALAFAGLGLLVASRARTLEGISGLTNLVMMPLWLGCGVFFSHERFPEPVRPWLAALPLTPLNDGLRAILLAGEGPLALAGPLACLAAWGSAGFLGALALFRWR